VPFLGFNAEEVEELLSPLSKEKLGRHEQDATRILGQPLGHDQARFDRLSQTDFIGKDAASVVESRQSEDDGVDLMWIGVNSTSPLRSNVSTALVGAPEPDQLFGLPTALQGVERLSKGHHGANSTLDP